MMLDTLHHFKAVSVLRQDNCGIMSEYVDIMLIICKDLGIILGTFQDHFETIMGSFWDHYGIISESLGIILKSFPTISIPGASKTKSN